MFVEYSQSKQTRTTTTTMGTPASPRSIKTSIPNFRKKVLPDSNMVKLAKVCCKCPLAGGVSLGTG